MRKLKKSRILALLLACVLVVGSSSTMALAGSDEEDTSVIVVESEEETSEVTAADEEETSETTVEEEEETVDESEVETESETESDTPDEEPTEDEDTSETGIAFLSQTEEADASDDVMTLADATVSDAEAFKLAVASAVDGDTITLESDIELSDENGDFVTVSAGITIDLGGHTISVSDGSEGNSLFEVKGNTDGSEFTFTVKNGTLDGGNSAESHAIYLESNSKANLVLDGVTFKDFAQTAVYINTSGNVTVTDCTFAGNKHTEGTQATDGSGAGIYMCYSGELTVTKSIFSDNSANSYGGGLFAYYNTGDVIITDNVFTGNTADFGAGFAAEDVTGNLTISKNEVIGNEAKYSGGGIIFEYIIGNISITENTISKNIANSQGGGFDIYNTNGNLIVTGNQVYDNTADQGGGGNIYSTSTAYYFGTSVEITDNVFHDNKALGVNGEKGDGGGLNFDEENHHANDPSTTPYDFSGNTFYDNEAYRYGGGVSFYSDNTNRDIVIRSGLYYGNSADIGGAISYARNVSSYPETATLRLYSAIITENEAEYAGGGMWFCPYSGLQKSTTMGVAIYGNSAGLSGDDFSYDGHHSQEAGTSIQISYRSLGGSLMEWYSDEEEARYLDDAGTLFDYNSEIFTGTNESFNAHAVLSSNAIALAEEEATLYIYNNYASEVGGGIASNNPVVFGESTDMVVDAEKVWKDKNGNVLSDKEIEDFSVDVTLIRVDEDGNEVELETVTLSEDNNWEWDFEYLPTRYLGKDDGLEHVYTFTTKEVTHVDSFSPAYEIETDENGDEYITITNREQEFYDIDEEIVEDTGNIFNTSKWEKSESVNAYNAIEIEMSTYIPYMTAQDLIDSTYTMNFHNMLDSELVLDETDADFSVYIAGEKIDHKYYTVTTASTASPAGIQPFSVGTSVDDGCSFHVDVDLSALYADGVITDDDLLGETAISVFFFVDLEGTGLNGTYSSTVWYEVYEDDVAVYTSDVDTISVYTYEVYILKYDGSTLVDEDYAASALEGAEFGIFYDEECTDPVIRKYTTSSFEDTDTEYTVTSGEGGEAIFYGLAEGTYYVQELEAPEGYVLIEDPQEVVLGEALNDSNYMAAFALANTPEEEELPETEDNPWTELDVPDDGEPPVDDDGEVPGTDETVSGEESEEEETSEAVVLGVSTSWYAMIVLLCGLCLCAAAGGMVIFRKSRR